MEALKTLAVNFLTSRKFLTMVGTQIMFVLVWLNTKIPAGLEGLALSEAQLQATSNYMSNATVVVVAWLLAQGMADTGKWFSNKG